MNPPHILLVDDEPNILKSLQRLLFEDDYDLCSASSGEGGLEILREQEIDLIIADYRMPGMTGIEFFCEARRVRPDAVRIILSGYAEIQALTDAINEGHIYKFIFKPWNDEDLKNTIRLALEQKTLVLENRNLTLELQQKNSQLEDFNRELEIKVAKRTQELLYRNKVLSISQEILERVPVGVVGFSDMGEVVLINQSARNLFDSSIGLPLERILPEALAQSCHQALQAGTPISAKVELNGSYLEAHIERLSAETSASGGMLILHPVSDHDLQTA